MSDPLGDPINHAAAVQAASALVDNPEVQEFVRPSREIAKAHAAKLTDIVLGAFVAAFYPLARFRMKGDAENKSYQDDMEAKVLKHEAVLAANSRVFVQELVDKASLIPEENLINPQLNVAIPAFQSAAYCEDEPELRRLYVNLLAASMDSQQVRRAQPGFAEVIRQISPDEARMIHFLAQVGLYPTISVHGVRSKPGESGLRNILLLSQQTALIDDVKLDDPSQISVYWSNLSRLGTVNLADANHFPVLTIDAEEFGFSTDLEKRPEIIEFVKASASQMSNDNLTPLYQGFNFGYGATSLSAFGKAFHEVCYGE